MRPYTGKHTNKVDRKGRVSVPAPFRTLIREELENNGEIKEGEPLRISVRMAKNHKAIEVLSDHLVFELGNRSDEYPLESIEEEDLLYTIYAEMKVLEIDREGRILIPRDMLEAAGISEAATFVGLKNRFHIWDPATFDAKLPEIQKRGAGLSLPKAGRSGDAR